MQIKAALKSLFSLKNPGPLQVWARDLLDTTSQDIRNPYAQSIWVYRAISVWCRIAQVPIVVVNKRTGEEVTASGVLDLINSPNSFQTFDQLLEDCILQLAISGNSFVTKDDGQKVAGKPEFQR